MRRRSRSRLQHVEPLDVGAGHRLGEHAVLDLVDLLLDLLQHRHVVVDDEIEDGIEDEILALGERGRAALPMLAHRRVGRRRAVPDADDVALADEEMRFAEGDAAADELGGARDDEQRIAILFELRPLVRMLGVLDGEVVQAELALHPVQEIAARLPQADPDDMPVLLGPHARLVDRDVGDALSVRIDAGGDDAVFGTVGRARCR